MGRHEMQYEAPAKVVVLLAGIRGIGRREFHSIRSAPPHATCGKTWPTCRRASNSSYPSPLSRAAADRTSPCCKCPPPSCASTRSSRHTRPISSQALRCREVPPPPSLPLVLAAADGGPSLLLAASGVGSAASLLLLLLLQRHCDSAAGSLALCGQPGQHGGSSRSWRRRPLAALHLHKGNRRHAGIMRRPAQRSMSAHSASTGGERLPWFGGNTRSAQAGCRHCFDGKESDQRIVQSGTGRGSQAASSTAAAHGASRCCAERSPCRLPVIARTTVSVQVLLALLTSSQRRCKKVRPAASV